MVSPEATFIKLIAFRQRIDDKCKTQETDKTAPAFCIEKRERIYDEVYDKTDQMPKHETVRIIINCDVIREPHQRQSEGG